MVFSIAEWKYRNILQEHGGPIASLTHYHFENYPGHHSFAELRPELIPPKKSESIVYRHGGGQGTSFKSKMEASYKAISESLERWAYYQMVDSKEAFLYGFDIDSSSSGMACFPGLTKNRAKQQARLEAIERWSLIAWWEGHLSIGKIKTINFLDKKSCDAYLIQSLWDGIYTVLLNSASLEKNFPIYAFGADFSVDLAIQKSLVELGRNSRSIDRFCKDYECFDDSKLASLDQILTSTMEKRLVYFATQEGKADFEATIHRDRVEAVAVPKVLIDKEIPGPWSKYGTVWRHAFFPLSDNFQSEAKDYFFF